MTTTRSGILLGSFYGVARRANSTAKQGRVREGEMPIPIQGDNRYTASWTILPCAGLRIVTTGCMVAKWQW